MSVTTAASASEAQQTPTRPIFVFESDGIRYGFEAMRVREVFFLPQVAPLPEAPRDIIGAIDLRGRIVPVMDLQRRFGYTTRDYCLTDSAIVFECDGLLVALVVNAVITVCDVPLEDFREAPTYGRSHGGSQAASEATARHHRFINGIAQTPDGTVLLLDCSQLVHYSEGLDLDEFPLEDEEPDDDRPREFCPNATPEQRQVFQKRAIALQTRTDDAAKSGAQPTAIIEISGEFFGLDLQVVREFCEVSKIVPVPCCPDRILGSTNLRGEILTLVSLHEVLGLTAYRREGVTEAVVVEVGETVFGIAIDAVFDVMQLTSDDLSPTPTALQGRGEEFVRGMASYRGKILGVLDLPAIVEREVLVVDD
ncbi:MAG: chemotaxis protein CheW [Geitlerinemataceae cyanobacterium]